jgi:hypothetical protein
MGGTYTGFCTGLLGRGGCRMLGGGGLAILLIWGLGICGEIRGGCSF